MAQLGTELQNNKHKTCSVKGPQFLFPQSGIESKQNVWKVYYHVANVGKNKLCEINNKITNEEILFLIVHKLFAHMLV